MWSRGYRPALWLVTSLTGCSFMQPATQPVAIMATDPSAQILVQGAAVGTGSATVNLARNEQHQILARTPDGRSGMATIQSRMGPAGVLDIVMGSFLVVPFFGLLSPGSRVLATSSVVVELPAEKETTEVSPKKRPSGSL